MRDRISNRGGFRVSEAMFVAEHANRCRNGFTWLAGIRVVLLLGVVGALVGAYFR